MRLFRVAVVVLGIITIASCGEDASTTILPPIQLPITIATPESASILAHSASVPANTGTHLPTATSKIVLLPTDMPAPTSTSISHTATAVPTSLATLTPVRTGASTLHPIQSSPTYESQGYLFGKAYADADDLVFIKVNDYEVNYREYVELKARFITNLTNHKIQIAEAVPDGEWTQPQGEETHYTTRPLPSFMINDGFKQTVAIMEKHGVDAGALGGLILDYARYSAAIDGGFDISDAELAVEVADVRAIYEDNVAITRQSLIGEFKGYIDAVGEDKFWDEIYPAKLRRMLVVADWRENALDKEFAGRGVSGNDRDRIMSALDREVLAKVDVQLVDDSRLKATVEQSLDYIQEYNTHMYRAE